MTQPYANARVEVTLDFGQIEAELQARLNVAVGEAVKVAIKHFEKLSKQVDKTAREMRTKFSTALSVMEAKSRQAAQNVGDHWERAGDRISRAIDRATTRSAIAMSRLSLMAQKQASKMADSYEDAFDRILTRATTVLSAIRTEMQSLPNSTLNVRIEFDDAQALGRLQQLMARLQGYLNSNHLTVFVDLEAGDFEQRVAFLTRNRNIQVDMDVDRNNSVGRLASSMRVFSGMGSILGGIGSMLGSAASAAGTFAKGLGVAGAAVVALGAAAPAVAALAAAIGATAVAAGGALVAGLSAAAVGVAALKVGLSGFSETVKLAFDPEKVEEFNKAMAKLSPEARDAAYGIVELKDGFEGLDIKSAVQDSLFDGLGDRIRGLGQFLPLLKDSLLTVVDGFNEGAKSALDFVNSAEGLSTVTDIFAGGSNMAANFGAAITGIVPGLLSIAGAATNVFSPLTDGIGGFARQFSEQMAMMKANGSLEEIFTKALEVAKQFGAVLVDVGGIISGVFNAASTAGSGLMSGLGAVLDQVNAFVNSDVGQSALVTFFQSMMTAVSAVMPVITQLATIIGTQVAPIIATLLSVLGPALGPVLDALSQGITALTPAIGPIAEAIGSITQAVAPLLPILGELLAKFFEFAGPILGMLAEALSPILGAIGEGLISAFQALMPALEPIGILLEALSPLFTQIATIAGEVLAGVITALVPVITTLATGFAQVLEALMPILPVLGDALMQIIAAVAPMIQQMAGVWLQVVQAILPLLPILIQIVASLLPPLLQLFTALLPILMMGAQLFASLVVAMAPIMVVVGQIIAKFAEFLGFLIGVFAQIVGAVVGFVGEVIGLFGNLATGLSEKAVLAKDWVIETFTQMIDWFKGLPEVFKQFAGNIFSPILDAAKAVFNSIADVWNNTAGKLSFKAPDWVPGIGGKGFDMPDIPKMRTGGLIARRLSSGLLQGPGGARDDKILGMIGGMPAVRVSADEMVMNGKATKANYPLLAAMNNGHDLAKLMKIPGLAGGGLVSAQQLIDFARGVEGQPYEWGGVNWGDCSGAVSAIANFATGQDPFGSRFATMSEDAELKARGFLPGLGPDGSLNVGWYNGGEAGGHTAATLPDGTNFEMGGARGDGQFGGQAAGADDSMFTDHAHLPPDHFIGLDPGSPTTGGATATGATATAGGGSLIGSGLGGGTSGGGGGGGGGGSSWGNSGGGSKFNSAADAKTAGITPVWVENWPATMTTTGALAGTPSDMSTSLTTGPASTTAPEIAMPEKDLRQGATKEEITAAIVAEGRARGLSDEDIQSAVSTALVESGMQNYANQNDAASLNLPHDAVGTDHDSVGVFQQRPSMGWGTTEELMDPKIAAQRYYDALEKVEGREGMSVGERAQAVQRSAFPDRYDERAGEARTLMDSINANSGAMPVTIVDPAVPVEVPPGTATTTGQTEFVDAGPTVSSAPVTADIGPSVDSSSPTYGNGTPMFGTPDFNAQMQDIGISAIKETIGGALDPFGLSSLFDAGFDKLVAAFKENQAREVKFADTANFYGMDPPKAEKAVTTGMSNVTDTNRAAY